jgi:hypothetical protein
VIKEAAGAIGLIGLFAAIVVGMLATFGAFGQEAPGEPGIAVGEETTVETTERIAEQVSPVGETVTAGDVSWTVDETYPKDEVSKYTFPPGSEPGSYVHLRFTVENTSDRPITLTDDTIAVYDAAGTEYLPEPDRNSTYIKYEYNILFNELGLLHPGETKEGRVNVGVLPNSEGFIVRLGDTDPTREEEEYVELGF